MTLRQAEVEADQVPALDSLGQGIGLSDDVLFAGIGQKDARSNRITIHLTAMVNRSYSTGLTRGETVTVEHDIVVATHGGVTKTLQSLFATVMPVTDDNASVLIVVWKHGMRMLSLTEADALTEELLKNLK